MMSDNNQDETFNYCQSEEVGLENELESSKLDQILDLCHHLDNRLSSLEVEIRSRLQQGMLLLRPNTVNVT